MTGGQSALALDSGNSRGKTSLDTAIAPLRTPGIALAVPAPDAEELRQHESLLEIIHKSSGGKTVWRALAMNMAGPDGDGTHRNH